MQKAKEVCSREIWKAFKTELFHYFTFKTQNYFQKVFLLSFFQLFHNVPSYTYCQWWYFKNKTSFFYCSGPLIAKTILNFSTIYHVYVMQIILLIRENHFTDILNLKKKPKGTQTKLWMDLDRAQLIRYGKCLCSFLLRPSTEAEQAISSSLVSILSALANWSHRAHPGQIKPLWLQHFCGV